MERTEVDRTQADPPRRLAQGGVRLLEERGLLTGPPRDQPPDPGIAQPAEHEGQGPRGRRVQPLAVVDGQEQGSVRGPPSDHRGQGHADRPLVDGFVGGHPQQRGTERLTLGGRQPIDLVRWPATDQVAQRDEGEGLLHRGRCALDHLERSGASEIDGRPPEHRLADAGLALEQEATRRAGAGGRRGDELVHGLELEGTTDDVRSGR